MVGFWLIQPSIVKQSVSFSLQEAEAPAPSLGSDDLEAEAASATDDAEEEGSDDEEPVANAPSMQVGEHKLAPPICLCSHFASRHGRAVDISLSGLSSFFLCRDTRPLSAITSLAHRKISPFLIQDHTALKVLLIFGPVVFAQCRTRESFST